MAARRKPPAGSKARARTAGAKKTPPKSRSPKKTAPRKKVVATKKPGNAPKRINASRSRTAQRTERTSNLKAVRIGVGHHEGLEGVIVREDARTGMLFVSLHIFRDHPVYAGHEWGPYFPSELTQA